MCATYLDAWLSRIAMSAKPAEYCPIWNLWLAHREVTESPIPLSLSELL